jgi:hypothetical protein
VAKASPAVGCRPVNDGPTGQVEYIWTVASGEGIVHLHDEDGSGFEQPGGHEAARRSSPRWRASSARSAATSTAEATHDAPAWVGRPAASPRVVGCLSGVGPLRGRWGAWGSFPPVPGSGCGGEIGVGGADWKHDFSMNYIRMG